MQNSTDSNEFISAIEGRSMHKRIDAACRVALVGLVHDLGKFSQRTGLKVPKEKEEVHKQLYCPQKEMGNQIWWTHSHAAYTALSFDALESAAPDLVKTDAYPFASRTEGEDITDSIVNAAARHHNPKTFMQWVIATADRVASGFEREVYDEKDEGVFHRGGHITTRLRSLLEEVSLDEKLITKESLKVALPLSPLSAASLFPMPLSEIEGENVEKAKQEYTKLWEKFSEALSPSATEPIPDAFRKNWSLWIDAFDSLWMTFTSSIPSATAFSVRPDVSLYDHCKATAALASALWLWHEENGKTGPETVLALKDRSDWDEKKFLLIQGDFFGIQNFIFSEGSQTNKKSAKILRGRSFYVSLLSELAALKILQTLDLPSTSQILNAAGKFLIVAPNTQETIEKLEAVRKEFDAWFIRHTFATAGIGIAWTAASCQDFMYKNYAELTKCLYDTIDRAKYQRFGLTSLKHPVLEADYSEGVCSWQSRLPADGTTEGEPTCALTRDELLVGSALASFKRILILEGDAEIHNSETVKVLELPIFGMKVAFVQEPERSGYFSQLASDLKLLRCWDFSLPDSADEVLWHGFARRNINGYVPRYEENDFIYGEITREEGKNIGDIKQFSDIAMANSHDGEGLKALMAIKGDVDNLGLIFQKGLRGNGREMNFAKTAGLSRQMNSFFAVWLPLACKKNFPNMYTIFAGGDDFFLIGPWRDSQRLVLAAERDFQKYTGLNPDVHFSVGTAMTKPGVPVRTLSKNAEEALDVAKSSGKNRLSLFGEVVQWSDMKRLNETEVFLESAKDQYGVSSGYLYDLFLLLDLAGEEKHKPEAAIWRSRLYYNTARLFERQKLSRSRETAQQRNEFLRTLLNYLEVEKTQFRIPLTNVFYSVRKTR